MSSKLPTHIQYRNATYYGLVENYQRNGHGLLILDNSHIIFGTCHITQPTGRRTTSTANISTSLITAEHMAPWSTIDSTATTSFPWRQTRTFVTNDPSMACLDKINCMGRPLLLKITWLWSHNSLIISWKKSYLRLASRIERSTRR